MQPGVQQQGMQSPFVGGGMFGGMMSSYYGYGMGVGMGMGMPLPLDPLTTWCAFPRLPSHVVASNCVMV